MSLRYQDNEFTIFPDDGRDTLHIVHEGAKKLSRKAKPLGHPLTKKI